MPELPEVENTKLSLLPIKGKQIVGVFTSSKKLRKNIPENILEVKNSIIINIKRKAKYLIFDLDCNKTIISHLGMSGKFIYSDENSINKHDHIILYLNNAYNLKYNDPRRFGVFLLEDTDQYMKKLFHDTAIDAIDDNFTTDYLLNKISKISSNIKNTLLNQKIVAGIGNIYASEALFHAKISPLRTANSLNYVELSILVLSIKEILNKAIKLGGSTLKDYRKADGKIGEFQNHFSVYSKENQCCSHKNCDGIIEKIFQNGRSTFYCKKSQK